MPDATADAAVPVAAVPLQAVPRPATIESVRLLELLLAQPLDDEQWERLAKLDPALARLHGWRSRVHFARLTCLGLSAAAVLAFALLALTLLLLLLTLLLRPELADSLQPTVAYIASRLFGLPLDRPCLVTPTSLLPNTISLQLLRPTVGDCDFCRNLTEVPRVSGLNPADFYRDYVEARVPVVVTDGARDWRLSHLSFDFFRNLYASGAAIENEHCQFFPYKTEFTDLGHFFSMPEARAHMEPGSSPWYVGWSNCSPRIAAILRSYYSRPYFLPRESETLGTDWIFMSSPNYGAHMHVDDVGHPSWQAQVRGRKRWDLMPPLECSYQCRPLSVVVQPGEVISLDTTLWYHSTHILEGDMSIAIGAEFD